MPTSRSKQTKKSQINNLTLHLKKVEKGFPGGTVVESLPAGAGGTGSGPGLGGSHMPRSN